MNTRQNAIAQSFVRADEFVDSRKAADFTHTPPTKVDVKIASAHQRLKSAVADLGEKQAIQSGGAFGESTQSQRTLRADLIEELRDIVRTAEAISEETGNEAMMDRFRMPGGRGDEELKARARGMAAAIRDLSLHEEFEGHGHGEDTAADLEESIAEFEASEGEQGAALGQQAGATATFLKHSAPENPLSRPSTPSSTASMPSGSISSPPGAPPATSSGLRSGRNRPQLRLPPETFRRLSAFSPARYRVQNTLQSHRGPSLNQSASAYSVHTLSAEAWRRASAEFS